MPSYFFPQRERERERKKTRIVGVAVIERDGKKKQEVTVIESERESANRPTIKKKKCLKEKEGRNQRENLQTDSTPFRYICLFRLSGMKFF